ncbi:putative flavoprotein [Secundilactobacillus pentosiphilus]|uniref:Putative flavoprotein n=1 Tax=Secundilactobacillus pentosiphilus TaxID=1714682 RepID=A0A1Z5IXE1_9LACO|nr:NADPH-dependent FMN reductase [Secundilactobacillus pentosiphilus]GAX06435.1 putative flavoprotein [Secundilactobacillus pentosiphilus]
MGQTFIGIVGNNAQHSYNRQLLQYMAVHYKNKVNIQLEEIAAFPLFSENLLGGPAPQCVTDLTTAIQQSDGVIIATPEYDHAIPAVLKSAIEWLSSATHPFNEKPVMIVGASLGVQGTARAQDNLHQILNSPGVNAFVLPGCEFLLNNAQQKFDDQNNLIDTQTATFLDDCFNHFLQFATDTKRNLPVG